MYILHLLLWYTLYSIYYIHFTDKPLTSVYSQLQSKSKSIPHETLYILYPNSTDGCFAIEKDVVCSFKFLHSVSYFTLFDSDYNLLCTSPQKCFIHSQGHFMMYLILFFKLLLLNLLMLPYYLYSILRSRTRVDYTSIN